MEEDDICVEHLPPHVTPLQIVILNDSNQSVRHHHWTTELHARSAATKQSKQWWWWETAGTFQHTLTNGMG